MSWLEILTLALLPAFLLLDLLHRAHADRRSRGWRTRALVVTAFNFGLSLVLGAWWVELFGGRSLFDGSVLGTAGGAMVGVLAYELVHYAYHRAAHRFGWLWRLGHQMHHSAESLDAFGAYYLHPLDAGLFITWSALVLYPVLGLTPESGALAAAALTFFAVFQHADIRTPRWLGYFVQRPESHRIHHARGVHAHNYSDLPLWDMLFGTFRNPAAAEAGVAQGFYDGASRRVPEMLAMRDVSVARAAQSSSAGT